MGRKTGRSTKWLDIGILLLLTWGSFIVQTYSQPTPPAPQPETPPNPEPKTTTTPPPPPVSNCGSSPPCDEGFHCMLLIDDEKEAEYFNVTWEVPDEENPEGPPKTVITKPPVNDDLEDIPPGANPDSRKCVIADPVQFEQLLPECVCVGDLEQSNLNFLHKATKGKAKNSIRKMTHGQKSAKPNAKNPIKRAIPPPPPCIKRSHKACIAEYYTNVIKEKLEVVAERSNQAEEGAPCDPGKEFLLTEALSHVDNEEFLQRALALADKLSQAELCNRRRLMSCSSGTRTCGCSDESPLPPWQQSRTGHRSFSSIGLKSYYCYPIEGSCSEDPADILLQIHNVEDKVRAHYGDPNIPEHFNNDGCLKNLCAGRGSSSARLCGKDTDTGDWP